MPKSVVMTLFGCKVKLSKTRSRVLHVHVQTHVRQLFCTVEVLYMYMHKLRGERDEDRERKVEGKLGY